MNMYPYDSTRAALLTPERRDTLFHNGASYSPEQVAIESARLAYIRFEESVSERKRLEDVLHGIGFDEVGFFSTDHSLFGTDTQAFAAKNLSTGSVIVSFRGTQPDKVTDLLDDLDALSTPWKNGGGNVHQGFANAFIRIQSLIFKWLTDHRVNNRDIIISGHSLGAALATLAASTWQPGKLITIGSPRVGDDGFSKTLSNIDAMRFVNCCDAVTQVPPECEYYTHIGKFYYLDKSGEIRDDWAVDKISLDKEAARLEYMEKEAWKIGRVIVRDLADHAPINYVRSVFHKP